MSKPSKNGFDRASSKEKIIWGLVEIHSIDNALCIHVQVDWITRNLDRHKKDSDLFIHMRIARCEGFEVYKWQRLQSEIRVVGTRDCWRAFRCIPYRIMSALDRMRGLKIVLVQEISRKADECRWPWDSTDLDILDLDCRQYRKIGRFVRSCLHPLHHSGILADRWKPRTIGKTAKCDLKSGDPIEMQPLQLLRWSDWWFLDTALQGGGGKNLKSRHHWCDLGLWGETSRFYWDALVASPQSCAHAENLGQELLLKMPFCSLAHLFDNLVKTLISIVKWVNMRALGSH